MFFTSASQALAAGVEQTLQSSASSMQGLLGRARDIFTLPNIVAALVVLLVCAALVKLLLKMTRKMLDKSKLGSSLHAFIYSSVKLILIFIVIMLLAGTLGIDTSSLLAVFSVAGLALSLSIQDALGNLISGVMILTSRPFQEGDFVEIKGRSGTVQKIGLIHTQLATLDRQILFIPNSQVTSNDFSNYSACTERLLVVPVKADYGCPVEQVKAALLKAAQDDRVLPDKPVFARVTGYGDHAIEYSLRVWVKKEDYWDVNFDLLERVKQVFDQEGIRMTYPHVMVHQVEQ